MTEKIPGVNPKYQYERMFKYSRDDVTHKVSVRDDVIYKVSVRDDVTYKVSVRDNVIHEVSVRVSHP